MHQTTKYQKQKEYVEKWRKSIIHFLLYPFNFHYWIYEFGLGLNYPPTEFKCSLCGNVEVNKVFYKDSIRIIQEQEREKTAFEVVNKLKEKANTTPPNLLLNEAVNIAWEYKINNNTTSSNY